MSTEQDSQEPKEEFAVLQMISWLQKQMAKQRDDIDTWPQFNLRYPAIEYKTFLELWKIAKEKIVSIEKASDPAEKKAILKKGLQGIISETKNEKVRLQATRELAELEGLSGDDMISCLKYAEKIKEMDEQDAEQFGVPPEDSKRLHYLGKGVAGELIIIEMEDGVRFNKVRIIKYPAGTTLTETVYGFAAPAPNEDEPASKIIEP